MKNTQTRNTRNIYSDSPATGNNNSKSDELNLDTTYDELDYGCSLPDGIIYMMGDIILGMSYDLMIKTRLIINYRAENKLPEDDPITIILNSDGGDLYEAFAIIDYMESQSIKFNVLVRGRAMSAAALILVGATGIKMSSKRSTIMIHELSSYGNESKASDIKTNVRHIEHLETKIFEILTTNTNQLEDFWDKNSRRDFYMSAEKAKELGVIHEIL